MVETIPRNHAEGSYVMWWGQSVQRIPVLSVSMWRYSQELAMSLTLHTVTQVKIPSNARAGVRIFVRWLSLILIDMLLFLLSRDLSTSRNWPTVRETAGQWQPSWSHSAHFSSEIEIIWLGMFNKPFCSYPIINPPGRNVQLYYKPSLGAQVDFRRMSILFSTSFPRSRSRRTDDSKKTTWISLWCYVAICFLMY